MSPRLRQLLRCVLPVLSVTASCVQRLDLSTRDDFATVAHTTTVSEGSGRTSYTPPSTVAAPQEGTLYWRVVAIDQAAAVVILQAALDAERASGEAPGSLVDPAAKGPRSAEVREA